MNKVNLHQILNFLIASVWLVNGLICKVLNLVPRHRQIVSRILQLDNTALITTMIGIGEIVMAIWILSRFRSKLNSLIQIILVAIMNSMEFFLAPDLLLWGKANALFAFLFILLIYYNEFYIHRQIVHSN